MPDTHFIFELETAFEIGFWKERMILQLPFFLISGGRLPFKGLTVVEFLIGHF